MWWVASGYDRTCLCGLIEVISISTENTKVYRCIDTCVSWQQSWVIIYIFLTNKAMRVNTWLTLCYDISVKISVGTITRAIKQSHIIRVALNTFVSRTAFTASPLTRFTPILNLNIYYLVVSIKVQSTFILT